MLGLGCDTGLATDEQALDLLHPCTGTEIGVFEFETGQAVLDVGPAEQVYDLSDQFIDRVPEDEYDHMLDEFCAQQMTLNPVDCGCGAPDEPCAPPAFGPDAATTLAELALDHGAVEGDEWGSVPGYPPTEFARAELPTGDAQVGRPVCFAVDDPTVGDECVVCCEDEVCTIVCTSYDEQGDHWRPKD